MRCIGALICKLRNERNMTREGLAQDICTPKYVYLIEKGERNPSISIIQRFSNRLAVDLFEYLKYGDCLQPELVKTLMEEMAVLRNSLQLVQLKVLTHKAATMADFKREPWRYELALNHLYFKVFEKSSPNFRKVLNQEILKLYKSHGGEVVVDSRGYTIGANTIESLLRAQLLNLLALNHAQIGEYMVALRLWSSLHDYLQKYSSMKAYMELYISVSLNPMFVLSHLSQWQRVIALGEGLALYQKINQRTERLFMTFFYKAQAYYYIQDYEKACRDYSIVKALRHVLLDSSAYNYIVSEAVSIKLEEMIERGLGR